MDGFAPNMTALTDTSVAGYHSVSFSPQTGFYLLNYLGPDIPKQTLITVDEPGKWFRRLVLVTRADMPWKMQN